MIIAPNSKTWFRHSSENEYSHSTIRSLSTATTIYQTVIYNTDEKLKIIFPNSTKDKKSKESNKMWCSDVAQESLMFDYRATMNTFFHVPDIQRSKQPAKH